jgi:hypothetical protein
LTKSLIYDKIDASFLQVNNLESERDSLLYAPVLDDASEAFMCIVQFPAGKKTGRWLVSPFQILAFDVKDSES